MSTETREKVTRLRFVAVIALLVVAGNACSQLVELGRWPHAIALGMAALLVAAAEVASRWSS